MKSYHEILGLDREPFGNSPDPDFFHSSPRHAECLRRLEIAVRLRRGLCVVTGEVGTGKTTLCRRFIRTLGYDQAVSAHLLPDPSYEDPRDFLAAVAVCFGIMVDGEDSASRIREAIQQFLLAEAADGDRIVVLCVDEGQKITGACLEILRELLNFETNTRKLLQIVIFAQNEFEATLRSRKNLADRVNTRLRLKPLPYAETKRLIRTRLRLAAGESWKEREPALFTRAAVYAIHRACGGYPRRIMRLCHASLLETVGREKPRAGLAEVRAARRAGGMGGPSWRAAAVAALPVAAVLVMLAGPGRERTVEMLDAGLLRVGEAVSKAPKSLAEIPGYETVRGLIASLEVRALDLTPASPREAAQEAPLAVSDAAPAAFEETSVVSDAQPVEEPGSVQVEAPAETPTAVPVAAPEIPAPASVPAPQALAAAATVSPAQPAVPADREPPAQPVGAAAEAQRLVPDVLPAVPSVSRSPVRLVELTAEPEPVVIEVSAAPAAAHPLVQPAASEPEARPESQAATAQPAAQPVVQAAALAPDAAPTTAQGQALAVASPDQAAPALFPPPKILGEVVVRPGWSLSKTAARLYGNGGRRVLSEVAAANPDIADLDHVRPGHRVALPVRRAEPLPHGACVVVLDRHTNLDEAFASLTPMRVLVPKAVLYAHFSPREGLVFDVVLDRYHADRASAQRALAALPGEAAARGTVVEYADREMVAYTALEPAGAGDGTGPVTTVAQNATTLP